MKTIAEYVSEHTDRGECKCGKCCDVGGKPDPTGHTADVVFFKVVSNGEPSADDFRRLTEEWGGEFVQCNPLDGSEHSYLELGGWIGDQGLALLYMALGKLLGVFELLTPKMLGLSDAEAMQLAGAGMVAVQTKRI